MIIDHELRCFENLSQKEPLLCSIDSIDKRFSKKKIASLLSKRNQKNFIQSAVLVPVIKKDNTLNLLFTIRSKKLKSHSGEICFPGGQWSDKDTSLVNTALRETREEIGIPYEKIKILGFLDSVPTLTGFLIHPIVGIIENEISLKIDNSEVEDYFYVPFNFFANKKNKIKRIVKIKNTDIPIFEYHYNDHRIWGATAAIASSLFSLLRLE
tara:strand:+ start:6993 stop:7625 length:633 start_codon:yes stop_codon:yes gene_type:complete